MQTIKVEKVVEHDGELHLTDLPCHKGDRVEAVLSISQEGDEASRAAARRRFLEHAEQHSFKSTGPYPSRDELHERH